MILSWSALAFIILAAAVAWFWQDSLAARERANAAATEACERLGLQFLDGTVAFARIALTRGRGGTLALRRTYIFDYTATSIERLQGFVVLLGHRIESVGYAAANQTSHQASRADIQTAPPINSPTANLPQTIPAENTPIDGEVQPPSRPPVAANVYDLEQWRINRRTPKAAPRESNEDLGDGRR